MIHQLNELMEQADVPGGGSTSIMLSSPLLRKITYVTFDNAQDASLQDCGRVLRPWHFFPPSPRTSSARTTSISVFFPQDFVGSNNINLLVPSGQFGTRLQGGKDAASARYIFTRLSPVTRKIFHPDDDAILDYLDEEGQRIEPKFYIPIIPMVLVNGVEGIGSGWSTSIPNYSPKDMISQMRRFIGQTKKMTEPQPWYRGFKGNIGASDVPGQYLVTGIVNKKDPKTLEITELPVKKWTQDYKEGLQKLLPSNFDKPENAWIQDFREYHTESSVNFELIMTDAQMEACKGDNLIERFKLK